MINAKKKNRIYYYSSITTNTKALYRVKKGLATILANTSSGEISQPLDCIGRDLSICLLVISEMRFHPGEADGVVELGEHGAWDGAELFL